MDDRRSSRASILHPSWHLPKVYGVKVRGHLSNDDLGLERMCRGMDLGDVSYRPAFVQVAAYRTRATWVEVVLTEGKSRQVRRMCRAVGFQTVKLRRLSIGPVELGELKPRCIRPLAAEELECLDEQVGLTDLR